MEKFLNKKWLFIWAAIIIFGGFVVFRYFFAKDGLGEIINSNTEMQVKIENALNIKTSRLDVDLLNQPKFKDMILSDFKLKKIEEITKSNKNPFLSANK